MSLFLPSLVRELQQDVRDLNQADLAEVDPEENSAKFMGILIKVRTVHDHYWVLGAQIIVNVNTLILL